MRLFTSQGVDGRAFLSQRNHSAKFFQLCWRDTVINRRSLRTYLVSDFGHILSCLQGFLVSPFALTITLDSLKGKAQSSRYATPPLGVSLSAFAAFEVAADASRCAWRAAFSDAFAAFSAAFFSLSALRRAASAAPLTSASAILSFLRPNLVGHVVEHLSRRAMSVGEKRALEETEEVAVAEKRARDEEPSEEVASGGAPAAAAAALTSPEH